MNFNENPTGQSKQYVTSKECEPANRMTEKPELLHIHQLKLQLYGPGKKTWPHLTSWPTHITIVTSVPDTLTIYNDTYKCGVPKNVKWCPKQTLFHNRNTSISQNKTSLFTNCVGISLQAIPTWIYKIGCDDPFITIVYKRGFLFLGGITVWVILGYLFERKI